MVESKTIRDDNSMKSRRGSPLLIFRNLIAANSKMLASSAAEVIMNVPIRITITSNSMNPSAAW